MPISATAIRDALMTALIALLDVTAKRGGPAELDRGHDAPLRRAQRRAMLRTIGVAVAAEHVRHFRPRPGHRPARLRSAGARWAAVRRALDAATAPGGLPWRRPCWWRSADSGL